MKHGFFNTIRKAINALVDTRFTEDDKSARLTKSRVKAMMIVCFNIRGPIMIQWVPDGRTVYQNLLLGGPDQAPRTSEEEKTEIVEEETMDFASRKCVGSQRPRRKAIFSR
jgi:hypothetical protein